MSTNCDPRELPGPSGDRLCDFSTEQWWFAELDQMTQGGTDDQKRALAVVRNLLATVRVVLDGVPNDGNPLQDPSDPQSNRIQQPVERNQELESRRVTLSPIDLDKVVCRCQTPGNVVGAECPVCSNPRKSIAYTLSRNLIVVRRARGFNLRDLAKQVGTSYVTISRFERGLIPAGVLVLARLSTALGVNLSDLLGLPTGLQSDLTVAQLNKTIDSLTEDVRRIREVVADQAVKIHTQAAKAQSVEKDLRVFAWLVSSRARLAPSGAPDLYRVHWVDQDGQHRSTVSSYANPMDAVLEAFERATQ